MELKQLIRKDELENNKKDRARREACEAIDEGKTLKTETWAVPA